MLPQLIFYQRFKENPDKSFGHKEHEDRTHEVNFVKNGNGGRCVSILQGPIINFAYRLPNECNIFKTVLKAIPKAGDSALNF